ncbi:MAG: DUF4145 domain-containing protein [Chitinophagaceae bacterium]
MPKLISTHCLSCKGHTNQKVLHCTVTEETPEDEDFYIRNQHEYMVIECAGCDTISFLKRITFLEPNDPDEQPMVADMNYPEDNSGFMFLAEEDQEILPRVLRKLYLEIISAFNAESEILSGIGLRTLVEAICVEQKIAGANLQKKIIGLKESGLISTNEVPILDKLRLIGNAATHQIKGIPIYMLCYALDIVNHVLKSIYVLPSINKKIKIR